MTETFLFLDTETTGFKKSGSLIQEGQSRVCQLAMILVDDTGKTLAEYQSMIRPDNWNTNGKTENYYGIKYEDCNIHGVDQAAVMKVFYSLSLSCSHIVAHNSAFDKGMMDIERAYDDTPTIFTENWYCTMLANTHITNNNKWPKLDFALRHYTGKYLIDAHDAMADTRACRDIFFAMRGIQL